MTDTEDKIIKDKLKFAREVLWSFVMITGMPLAVIYLRAENLHVADYFILIFSSICSLVIIALCYLYKYLLDSISPNEFEKRFFQVKK